MQKGSIRISGKFWYLKIRENVTVSGQSKRQITYHKLAPIDQHRPGSSGNAPQAVQAMADEIVGRVNAGKQQGLSVDSFKAYLDSYIAAGIGANGRPVRKTTLVSYKRDYNVIKNLIPDMPLRNVRTPDINKIFMALIQQDGDDIRATSAYRNVRNFLSGAFREAVGKGLVEFNPVRDARVLEGNDADTHAYTLAEVKELMNVIAAPKEGEQDDWRHTMRAAFMVAMFTGMRMEEIKGLKWEDYDKKAGVLNVRRTVVHHNVVEGTKTKDSAAPMPVVGIVAKELEAHLKRNTGDGFIFHKASGSDSPIIFEQIILEEVHPACAAAGIKFHGMHAFRRGLASYLHNTLQTGELLIGHILRHSRKSSKSVAGRHYIDRNVETVRKELEKVEAAYKKSEGRR
jgi:integrase